MRKNVSGVERSKLSNRWRRGCAIRRSARNSSLARERSRFISTTSIRSSASIAAPSSPATPRKRDSCRRADRLECESLHHSILIRPNIPLIGAIASRNQWISSRSMRRAGRNRIGRLEFGSRSGCRTQGGAIDPMVLAWAPKNSGLWPSLSIRLKLTTREAGLANDRLQSADANLVMVGDGNGYSTLRNFLLHYELLQNLLFSK
jgi:hypothetical protein